MFTFNLHLTLYKLLKHVWLKKKITYIDKRIRAPIVNNILIKSQVNSYTLQQAQYTI